MKNRNILLIFSLILAIALQAQYSDQYLHLNAGGGVHGLSYDIPGGTHKSAAGFTINAAYSYFFAPNWGLQTGIGIQSLGATSLLNFTTEMADVDSDGDANLFTTYYKDWQERQRSLLLDIPLAVQFRYPILPQLQLLASVGTKFSMPVSATFNTSGGAIQTTGRYPQWDLELTDIPSEGFSTTTQYYSGKSSLKSSFIGTFDAGVLYELTDKLDLYVGGYANYGLNNVLIPDTKYLYQKDGVYNGLFASEQVGSVIPVTAGVKVGVYWQIAQKRPVVKVVNDLTPIQSITVQETIPLEEAKDTIVLQEQLNVEIEEDIVQVAVVVEDDLVQVVDSFEMIKVIVESIDFNFRVNSALPTGMDMELMKLTSDYLKLNPNVQLYAVGHTCDLGPHAFNYQLGMDRAIMVKRALVRLGAPAKQIKALSKSYDELLVPNTSNENRIKNRRVQLIIVEQ